MARLRTLRVGGDRVHVDVEDPLVGKGRHLALAEAGLLGELAPGDRAQIELPFAVAARLQPAVEPVVVQEQQLRARRIEHEGAAGQVAGELAAQVRVVRVSLEKVAHEANVARLLFVAGNVRGEFPIERIPSLACHPRTSGKLCTGLLHKHAGTVEQREKESPIRGRESRPAL